MVNYYLCTYTFNPIIFNRSVHSVAFNVIHKDRDETHNEEKILKSTVQDIHHITIFVLAALYSLLEFPALIT